MKRTLSGVALAVAMSFAADAVAQATQPPGQAHVASRLASSFVRLAGSEENALALVNALRTGESVQLTYAPTGTSTTPAVSTIDPPTGKMGWGNVKISLALAQDQLSRLGVTNPTGEQLAAALNGGDVVVVNADGTTATASLRGVLQMRADGMGWGQIARQGGTSLGPVVSKVNVGNSSARATPPAASAKSLVTATGVAASSASRGLVTAQGAVTSNHGSGHGNGQAHGRGVVTAAGGSAATPAAHGRGHSSGGTSVVTAAGNGAARVTTAHGNPGGNGRGQGGGNGKGRGG